MSQEQTPAVSGEDDLPEQLRIRREKRAGLIERGVEPYPVSVLRTASLADIRAKYATLETDSTTGDIQSLTGRVIFKRDTGKLCFATLREGDSFGEQAMLQGGIRGATAIAGESTVLLEITAESLRSLLRTASPILTPVFEAMMLQQNMQNALRAKA